ncbi:multiprotein-bridging factor 1 family protein [Mesorhizobium sp.]|jgi:transcriptional regulator with XRE-family HTH domain|uniref:helix-turn-helix domain-containing protein n=1 Tax=Mesorhizobium sp. TaxID=1871066 RepID=UPI00356B0593
MPRGKGLLDWSQARLAARAGLSEGAVRYFEKGKRIPVDDKLVAMRSALDLAGIGFLGDGETDHSGLDSEAGIIQNNDM